MQDFPSSLLDHVVGAAFGILTASGVFGAILVWHRQGQNIRLEEKKRLDAERKAQEDREAGALNITQAEITRRLQIELDVYKAQGTMYKEYAGDMAKLLEQARVDNAAISAQLAQSMQQIAEGREIQYDTKRHLDKCQDDLAEMREDYAQLVSQAAARSAELTEQIRELQGRLDVLGG